MGGNGGLGKARWKSRKLVQGWGINDYEGSIRIGREHVSGYDIWIKVIERCINPRRQQLQPAYIDCTVCIKWKYFTVFKKWFDENSIEGYQLDKDILKKGNKVYSAETCCFVPPAINTLLINRKRDRGECVIGVFKKKGRPAKIYGAQINIDGKRKHLGYYKTEMEAFEVYKTAKEAHIKKVACQYFLDDKITVQVFQALMAWEISSKD